MASSIGVTQDLMLGAIYVVVHDCLGSYAPGVQVTTDNSDPRILEFYQFGSEATGTPSNGLAVFINVPPGLLSLTATPNTLGTPSSQFTVNVAAGTLTEVGMFPTPNP
ncbi:MAG: hypothetical protein ACLP1X_11670 [Polyangiaceae bacterium]|jgi:hypothetical protein